MASAVVVQAGDGQVFQFPTRAEAREFQAAAKDAGGTAVELIPAAPPAARTLYDIETHLAALVDTEEMVPAEREEEYRLELERTLSEVVEKRDRVGQFRLHLVSQIELAKAERRRLEDREALYQRALDKLDGYLTWIIDGLGLDAKGKRKNLDGKALTLGLHGCKKRVEVTDEEAVPAKYKRVTVTLPAATWELMMDSLDLELREQVLGEVTTPKADVNRTLAYTDLAAEVAIPGFSLVGGTYVEVK